MIRSRAISACIASIFVIACATAGSKTNDSERFIAPQLVMRGPMEGMHFQNTDALVPLRADIDVVIDSTGVPIMSTFKAVGSAAVGNHDALYHYVEASTFKPAFRDGRPVTAVYHDSMKFEVRAR